MKVRESTKWQYRIQTPCPKEQNECIQIFEQIQNGNTASKLQVIKNKMNTYKSLNKGTKHAFVSFNVNTLVNNLMSQAAASPSP
jgi:hypothetical protein